jgi:hypothetical protein
MRVPALGPGGPVALVLTWSRADPLTVRMRFPEAGVQWMVARELLALGLLGPAGLGDVTLLPDLDDPGHLELILSSPDGSVCLQLRRCELVGFLSAIWRLIPGGEPEPAPDPEPEPAPRPEPEPGPSGWGWPDQV